MQRTLFPIESLAAALLAVVIMASLLASPAAIAAEDDAKPDARSAWTDLLPANKLDKHWHTKGNWLIDEEGVVRLEPREGERGWQRYDAYLWLKDMQPADFEFQFEFKVNKGGNSGFYFHVGDLKSPVAKGIEVQIYDSGSKKPDAKMTDHDAGGIIPGVPPSKNTCKPAGQWNKFHIISKGDKLTVKLNGETVNEVDLNHPKLKDRPKKGYIGFQDHGLPLWLRGMRIRTP